MSASAQAMSLEWIPQSRHHQFKTYGLFIEDQTTLVLRNAARAWGAVGASLPVVEFSDNKWTPQLIAFVSANVGFRFNDKRDTVLTETVDARAGLQADFSVAEDTRIAFGWTHQSGHVSDDIQDQRMVGPNLGNEIIHLRVLHDFSDVVRIGGSLRPVIGSEPKLKPFAAEQFLEWTPFGVASALTRWTPYIAGGLEQYGVNSVTLSKHLQIGAYIGSHRYREHKQELRVVLGYYDGVDPRLKYAQYLLSRSQFGYLGIMIDI